MVKRIVYPPVWLLLALIGIFACDEYVPGPRFTHPAGQVAGALVILLGLWLLVSANGLFNRAGTNVIPFREATALVVHGVYRYTRNPMYLGMVAVLLGCAVTVGATTALAIPPVFAAIIDRRFIRFEEAMLRQRFPDQYPAYCDRVRRWL